MSYTFVRCLSHPKTNLQGWYLKLLPTDDETFKEIHRSVCSSIFQKYVVDPHFFENKDQTKPKHFVADLVSVPKLGGGWAMTVENMFHKYGAVFVNCAGGVMPPTDNILETVVKDELVFPTDAQHYGRETDKEFVKIIQWPNAQHYYLSSTNNRIFSPTKYDTFDEAYATALKYADKDHIKTEIKKVPKKKKDGD